MLRYSLLMLIFWFSLGTFGLSAQEDNSLVIVLEDDRFLLVPQYSSPAQLEYSMDWEPDQRDLKKTPFGLPPGPISPTCGTLSHRLAPAKKKFFLRGKHRRARGL
jgi:hypothetical protein